jgi:hypothetical protein
MAKNPVPRSTPLEREAEDTFQQLLAGFRVLLVDTANEIAENTPANREHYEAAYRRLIPPDKRWRDAAQANITKALKDNRVIEVGCYLAALVLFTLGIVLIVYCVFSENVSVERVVGVVAGSVSNVLLYIPMRFAINARKNNIAIRLLGYFLDRVDDPQLMAESVRRLIGEVLPGSASGEWPGKGVSA